MQSPAHHLCTTSSTSHASHDHNQLALRAANYAISAAPSLPTSLVLSRLSSSPTLLPENLASLITAISLCARVSIRASALFIEAILESAKYSTMTGLGLTRRALISAVGSARALHYVNQKLDWSGKDDTGAKTSDAFLQVLDKYTNLGVYMIHHTFTLAELFAMSGFYLTLSTVQTGFFAAEESVRMFDGILGSNETSRALSSVITLVRSELTQDPRFSPAERGAIASLTALTKALTAFVCLQTATHRRTLKSMQLRVIYDCTVTAAGSGSRQYSITEDLEPTATYSTDSIPSSPTATPSGHRRSMSTDTLMTDVRSEIEAGHSRPRSRTISADGEAAEIVEELQQLCAGDTDSDETDDDELPIEVREALKNVQDEQGNRKRVVRSEADAFDYEIEVEETVTTTTTTVRTVSSSEDGKRARPMTIARSTRPRLHSANPVEEDEEVEVEEMQEDEWVELGATNNSSGTMEDGDTVRALPAAYNGQSLATLTRQATLERPEESKQRLQVVLRTMTKKFTQRKRTIRRVDPTTPRSSTPLNSPPIKGSRPDLWGIDWTSAKEDFILGGGDEMEAPKAESPGKGKGVFKALGNALRSRASGENIANRSGKSSRGNSHNASLNSSTSSLASSPPPTPGPAKIPFPSAPPPPIELPVPSSSSSLAVPPPPSKRAALSPSPSHSTRNPTSPRPIPRRLHRTASSQSMRSVVTTSATASQSAAEAEPRASNFPHRHLVSNLQHFMRYSSAAYGQAFLRILGIGKHDFNFPHTHTHANNHAFAHHVGIPVDDILLSSHTDAAPSFSTQKLSPIVNFVSIDRANSAIVLSCRGSLGLSDVLVDLTCSYEPISVPDGDPNASYFVHSGIFCSATTLQRGTVHDTIREALEQYPTYGLVLCGHSLGGGVASLLSILWSSPATAFQRQAAQERLSTGQRVVHPRISTPFVTSFSSGLPPGRPISCYGFGVPCVASVDLVKYCRGLVTSTLNHLDIVPTLSLGVLRDLKTMAMGLYSEEGTAEEIVGRVIGLYQRRFMAGRNGSQTAPPEPSDTTASLTERPEDAKEVAFSSSEFVTGKGLNQALNPAYRDPSLMGGDISDDSELNDWLWSLIKTMRAGNDNDKLYPPGTCYVVEQYTVFISSSESSTSLARGGREKYERQEGRRVILRAVDSVESRFSEPVFGRSMMSDHSPAAYEETVDLLAQAVVA